MSAIPIMRPWLGAEEAAAVQAALESGWIAQGPRVAAFEGAVCAALGAEHGVATSSCTAALHLALHALGIGPGDEVVVPSLSFIATANAPRYVGARPVFADVDPETQNLTPETIERALTPATRAVILVHQAGMPADVDAVQAVCEARGVAVVEDAACAIGSTYHGRRIGGGRNLVALSFHPRKLVTTGEGGMLLTPDAGGARRLRRLREHGMAVASFERHAGGSVVLEQYVELGFNHRMTDLQAAVGLVQIGKLDAMVAERRRLAGRYREALDGVPGLRLPADPPYGTTNFQSYVVRLEDGVAAGRDAVMQELLDHGISTRRGIMAAHLEPAFAGVPAPPLPVTEWLTRRSLILPLFHGMAADGLDRVADALLGAVGAQRCR
jgi:dTDP-4-amino-4,6-dideoxygalactose transaminase